MAQRQQPGDAGLLLLHEELDGIGLPRGGVPLSLGLARHAGALGAAAIGALGDGGVGVELEQGMEGLGHKGGAYAARGAIVGPAEENPTNWPPTNRENHPENMAHRRPTPPPTN